MFYFMCHGFFYMQDLFFNTQFSSENHLCLFLRIAGNIPQVSSIFINITIIAIFTIITSTHPELYVKLASAWISLYPKIASMPEIDVAIEKSTKKNYQPPIIAGAYSALPTDENQQNTNHTQPKSFNDYIPSFLSTYFDKEVNKGGSRDGSEEEVTI